MEMQNFTFDRIGRLWCGEDANQPVKIIPTSWHASPGPLDNSLKYFHLQRQDENKHMLQLHLDEPDWRTACWVLKTAISQIVIDERVRGPFPLCHMDLHDSNMLLDHEYNLTAIIDWASAQAAPLEQLSFCMDFLTFPGQTEEGNQPIVEFKRCVIEALTKLESGGSQKTLPLPPDVDNKPQSSSPTASQGSIPLSSYLPSPGAEISMRHYMASARSGLWTAQMIAKLMYKDSVTWEQLRELYGNITVY